MENQVEVNPEVLNSWKEIANYMGRVVRTVQRYEELYGLPVRRVNGSRGPVISTRNEIDAWFATRGAAKITPEQAEHKVQRLATTRFAKREGLCRRWKCFSR